MFKDKIAESDKPEIHVRVSGLSASVFPHRVFWSSHVFLNSVIPGLRRRVKIGEICKILEK